MDEMTIFGLLMSKITAVSTKVKSILTGIVSITNVNNKLHYEFTDGTNADFDVESASDIAFTIDFTTGHMSVAGGGN